jgi:putative hydrolase of the HAD superfamily
VTPGPIEVVGFDADDTLWQSEDAFHAAEMRFVELLAPYAPTGVDIAAALRATERSNLSVSGYGVKAFGLSMIEAAVSLSERTVPATVIEELVQTVNGMLTEPVRLLPDVPEVLAEVGRHHRLILITKGDLVHQTRKITTSGLEHHFDHIEVVLEKDVATYARILRHVGVRPEHFVMVGNSVPSDVLPVIALGGHAVHIEYHLTWEVERPPVGHDADFAELSSLAELPWWLAQRRAAAS